MLSVTALPTINAALNGTSALLLSLGYLLIRQRKITAHKLCMGAALGTSTLFLMSYLTYHYQVGSIPFAGHGGIRALYFTILISHTVLAAAIPPLALITVYRALRGRFDRHVRIARWTLPLWLYVSVTGVIIYCMLYHLYPPA
ncbi:hypothetical protein CLG94_01060 [Candidatus Methylomirabilis limnetica]|uniref:DUF420 domain-containing protein n=1 Tax=Candidatus Methylomirabilis limnetica TaxID=2033718 RepID=A0A2T4U1B4_9BACT|nr:hypothetical protein CLG94_01060 [Candidatus Methylomirabilis limnetica]